MTSRGSGRESNPLNVDEPRDRKALQAPSPSGQPSAVPSEVPAILGSTIPSTVVRKPKLASLNQLLTQALQSISPRQGKGTEPVPAHDSEGLAYERQKDCVANARAQLPEAEQVQLHSVWVVEVYPPSRIYALLQGIARLGWNDLWDSGRKPLIKEIEHSRRNSYGGAWWNLSPIIWEQLRLPGGRQRLGLPSGVEHLDVTIHQRTPSTTIVILKFLLNAEVGRRIEEPFSREHVTYARPIGRGHQYITPWWQKKEETGEFRKEMRDRCQRWVQHHIPGLFSKFDAFPTAEFITLAEGLPFSPETEQLQSSYLGVLDLSADWEAAEDELGLRLGSILGRFSDEDEQRNLVFSANERALSDAIERKHARIYDTNGYVQSKLDGALALWATWHQLQFYGQSLAALRDRTATATQKSHIEEGAEAIAEIQQTLVWLSADATTLAAELSTESVRFTPLRRTAPEFKLLKPSPMFPTDVFATLEVWCAEAAKRLSHLVSEVRDVTVTTTSILGTMSQERATAANLRLQRWLFGLAILAVLLAVLQVVGAFM